jgi:hypothetical protein
MRDVTGNSTMSTMPTPLNVNVALIPGERASERASVQELEATEIEKTHGPQYREK